MVAGITHQPWRHTAGEVVALAAWISTGAVELMSEISASSMRYSSRRACPPARTRHVFPTERWQRIEAADGATRPAAGELVELQAPVEQAQPGGHLRVHEVRIGEVEAEVATDLAEIRVEHDALAAPEQIDLRQAHVEQKVLTRGDAGAGREGARGRFFDVASKSRRSSVRLAGRDVDVLEKAEAVQAFLAAAQLSSPKRLLLLQLQLAADDLVAVLVLPVMSILSMETAGPLLTL